MTRISTSPIATTQAEPAVGRTPEASTGAPFRALLRAAGRGDRTGDAPIDSSTTGSGAHSPGKPATVAARKIAAVDDADLVQANAVAQVITARAVAQGGTAPAATAVPSVVIDEDAPTAPISRVPAAGAGKLAKLAMPAGTEAAHAAAAHAGSSAVSPDPSLSPSPSPSPSLSPSPSPSPSLSPSLSLSPSSSLAPSPSLSAATAAKSLMPVGSRQVVATPTGAAASALGTSVTSVASSPATAAVDRAATAKPAAAKPSKAAGPTLDDTAADQAAAAPAPAAGSIAEAVASLTGDPSPASPASPAASFSPWITAGIGRATTATADVDTPDPTTVAGAAPATTGGFDFSAALTPLEQAVHDLIGKFSDRAPAEAHADDDHDGPSDAELASAHDLGSFSALGGFAAPQAQASSDAPAATTAPASPTHATTAATPPEPPSNPSHVHLVLDDGPERVVVTVAMRGNEVHVAMRGSDDATTAALARNAASLDHAMRARGLALGEFTAERERSQDRPRNHQPPDAEPKDRRKPDTEPFKLEDKP